MNKYIDKINDALKTEDGKDYFNKLHLFYKNTLDGSLIDRAVKIAFVQTESGLIRTDNIMQVIAAVDWGIK